MENRQFEIMYVSKYVDFFIFRVFWQSLQIQQKTAHKNHQSKITNKRKLITNPKNENWANVEIIKKKLKITSKISVLKEITFYVY